MNDTEQHIRAIWRKHEKEFAFRVHPDVKRAMEKYIGFNTTDDEEIALEDLDGLLKELMPVAKLAAESSFFRSPKELKNKEPRRRYQRPLNKRLHLVEFIISKQRLVNSDLITHPRIKWKTTCKAWNEAHPYDQMTKDVLKATFFRAVVDEDVQRAFYEKHIDEVLSTLPSGEHKLLRIFFGLEDRQSRKEALRELNVSNEEAYRMENTALRKLRHPSRSKKLEDLKQPEAFLNKHVLAIDMIKNVKQLVSSWTKAANEEKIK